MSDIDFLPIQYHQKNAYRHAKPWQIIVAASILGLLALATISQKVHCRLVENELRELGPAYEFAFSQKQHLVELEKQLKQKEIEAELITYLDHPWPCSQLLSALLVRLPAEITLQQLQIMRNRVSSATVAAAAERHPAAITPKSAEVQKALPPAEADLNLLRGQCDGKQTVITISGVAADSAALPHFLAEIQTSSLFSKAELGSATGPGDRFDAAIQFHAKIYVKPGYGQPGGPADTTSSKNMLGTETVYAEKTPLQNNFQDNLAPQTVSKSNQEAKN
jgi:Tfp pilus assembly protein PilN